MERVQVTDSLLAHDFSGPRLDWVLAEHRRLFSTPVPPGRDRVLVGHPFANMIAGDPVAGRVLPEGAALVVGPKSSARFAVLGNVDFARIEVAVQHGC